VEWVLVISFGAMLAIYLFMITAKILPFSRGLITMGLS